MGIQQSPQCSTASPLLVWLTPSLPPELAAPPLHVESDLGLPRTWCFECRVLEALTPPGGGRCVSTELLWRLGLCAS